MRKSIVIGSDRDLRSWLFEAEEAPAGGAPAGGAAAGDAPAGGAAPLDDAKLKEYESLMAMPFGQEFVSKLSELIKDDKVTAFLNAGLADGNAADDKISVKRGPIVVNSLKPTQSEIDLKGSVGWPFKNPGTIAGILAGKAGVINSPLVVSNGYVIDGHHRWSQVYCLNPSATIDCIDFVGFKSPGQALKMVDLAIAAKIKRLPTANVEAGFNIYDLRSNPANILNLFAKGGGTYMPLAFANACVAGGMKFSDGQQLLQQAIALAKATKISPERDAAGALAAKDAPKKNKTTYDRLKDYKKNTPAPAPLTEDRRGDVGDQNLASPSSSPAPFGSPSSSPSSGPAEAWANVACTIVDNCVSLPKPGIFPRPIMPQTDDAAGFGGSLEAGEVNISTPFAQGDKAETIKEGRLVYGFERRSSLPGIRRRY